MVGRNLKSTKATPNTIGSFVGPIISDSGLAFQKEVEANDDIDMASSLVGVGEYGGDLNSFGIDVGDTEVCGVSTR